MKAAWWLIAVGSALGVAWMLTTFHPLGVGALLLMGAGAFVMFEVLRTRSVHDRFRQPARQAISEAVARYALTEPATTSIAGRWFGMSPGGDRFELTADGTAELLSVAISLNTSVPREAMVRIATRTGPQETLFRPEELGFDAEFDRLCAVEVRDDEDAVRPWRLAWSPLPPAFLSRHVREVMRVAGARAKADEQAGRPYTLTLSQRMIEVDASLYGAAWPETLDAMVEAADAVAAGMRGLSWEGTSAMLIQQLETDPHAELRAVAASRLFQFFPDSATPELLEAVDPEALDLLGRVAWAGLRGPEALASLPEDVARQIPARGLSVVELLERASWSPAHLAALALEVIPFLDDSVYQSTCLRRELLERLEQAREGDDDVRRAWQALSEGRLPSAGGLTLAGTDGSERAGALEVAAATEGQLSPHREG